MGLRIAKVDEEAIAHRAHHRAGEALDHRRTDAMVGLDHVMVLFGIKVPGKASGLHQFPTEDRHLSTFGDCSTLGNCGGCLGGNLVRCYHRRNKPIPTSVHRLDELRCACRIPQYMPQLQIHPVSVDSLIAVSGHTVSMRTSSELFYVLEGSMLLEVEGKPPVTMKQGEASHLPPKEVHDVKNASTTTPMKALIFQIPDKGQPLVTSVR